MRAPSRRRPGYLAGVVNRAKNLEQEDWKDSANLGAMKHTTGIATVGATSSDVEWVKDTTTHQGSQEGAPRLLKDRSLRLQLHAIAKKLQKDANGLKEVTAGAIGGQTSESEDASGKNWHSWEPMQFRSSVAIWPAVLVQGENTSHGLKFGSARKIL